MLFRSTHVATARQSGDTVTVFNCLSGTSQCFTADMHDQNLTMDIVIKDIKIFENTIFVMFSENLIGWSLSMGEEMDSNQTLATCIPQGAILSHDCSQIAFHQSKEVFLYNVKTQRTISKDIDPQVYDIRFSLDGQQLWFAINRHDHCFWRLEITGDWSSTMVKKGDTKKGQLLFNHCSPHGYDVGMESEWVVDSEGSKLFWLPPNWRAPVEHVIRWDGDFLAFVETTNPEPMIIQLLPPH